MLWEISYTSTYMEGRGGGGSKVQSAKFTCVVAMEGGRVGLSGWGEGELLVPLRAMKEPS